MADVSRSLTLPQNRPSDDGSDVSNASARVGHSSESSTEGISAWPDKVDAVKGVSAGVEPHTVATSKNASVIKNSSPEGVDDQTSAHSDSPAKESISTQTSKKSARPRRVFKHQDQKRASSIITRARKVASEDTSVSAFGAEDVAELTKMVAQLSSLLAALEFGKEKVSRALAYMNGPSKVAPTQALFQVQLDLRHNRYRISSSKSSEGKKLDQDEAGNPEVAQTTTRVKDDNNASAPSPGTASKIKGAAESTSKKVIQQCEKAGDAVLGSDAVNKSTDEVEKPAPVGDKKRKPFFKHNWSFKGKYPGRGKKRNGTPVKAGPVSDSSIGGTDSDLSPRTAATVDAAPVA